MPPPYLKPNKNTPIWFRWRRRNRYSIAALRPLFPESVLVNGPREGIMLYSFATPQTDEVYAEVDSSTLKGVYIAGGPHSSARPAEVLQHFHYVVLGEGEETLPELIHALCNGLDPGHVNGLAYLKDGQMVLTGKRRPIDLDRYLSFRPPLLGPIEISRGCPVGCAYCQTPHIFGKCMRHRSINSILDHAKHLNAIRFTSPNALAYGSDGRRPRFDLVEGLLSKLHELGKPLFFGTFPSEVRPDFVTEKATELIDTYCTNRIVSLGGQSGSERMLNAMNRGHGVGEIIDACKMLIDYDLIPNVDLMIRIPGETEEDQLLTLDLAKWIVQIGGRVRAHHFIPIPGTRWENTKPSPLSPEVAASFGEMAKKGELTGRWWSALP